MQIIEGGADNKSLTWRSVMGRMADAIYRGAGEVLPLKDAVYCMDCDNVSRRTQTLECLVCGSGATIDLNRVLNRDGGLKADGGDDGRRASHL